MKPGIILANLLLGLVLAACSVSASSSTARPPVTLPPLPTPSARAATANPSGATGPVSVGNPSLPTAQVPITWGDLNLSGKLVFTSTDQNGNNPVARIQALDLGTGLLSTIFETSGGGLIYSAAVSPDERELVMTYTRPVGIGASNSPELFVLPLDGSSPPQLLFDPPSKDDEYVQPSFSADGKYLYFAHVNYAAPAVMENQHYPIFDVFRMSYPKGVHVQLADEAYWPRPSGDGNRLAYVSLDPLDGKNKLFVADSDGTNATQILAPGASVPDIIDAPIFSPDNQSILFSAVTPTIGSKRNWWENLLGITVASAHTVPSDWWSAPVAGGTPTQLTQLGAVGLYASISPDGQYLASYSGQGIFVMKPDGTDLTYLLEDVGGQPGTVSWLP
jgi:Tol biopolymer transport system component